MKAFLKNVFPQPMKDKIKQCLRGDPAAKLEWIPGPSIQCQHFQFRYLDRMLEAKADYTSPLYETITELVDYDSYQLGNIHWPDQGPLNVIDIGANIGISAILFASHPGVRVCCYEPLPINAQVLLANAALNQFDHVHVIEAAVAERDGHLSFQTHPTVNVAGRIIESAPGDTIPGSIQVPAVSIKTALENCGNNVFLIKMDCEGGEYTIIRQMTPEMTARIPYMTFEVHDIDRERNVRTFSTALEQLGYRLSYKPDMFGRKNLHHLLAHRHQPEQT